MVYRLQFLDLHRKWQRTDRNCGQLLSLCNLDKLPSVSHNYRRVHYIHTSGNGGSSKIQVHIVHKFVNKYSVDICNVQFQHHRNCPKLLHHRNRMQCILVVQIHRFLVHNDRNVVLPRFACSDNCHRSCHKMHCVIQLDYIRILENNYTISTDFSLLEVNQGPQLESRFGYGILV